jgi:hypothetical protein
VTIENALEAPDSFALFLVVKTVRRISTTSRIEPEPQQRCAILMPEHRFHSVHGLPKCIRTVLTSLLPQTMNGVVRNVSKSPHNSGSAIGSAASAVEGFVAKYDDRRLAVGPV